MKLMYLQLATIRACGHDCDIEEAGTERVLRNNITGTKWKQSYIEEHCHTVDDIMRLIQKDTERC